MTQYIHYEANIFMLNDLLRHIKRSLMTDIDNNYYLEKVKSDLLFSESKLSTLFNELKDSTLQLEKDQYLRHLYKTKNIFIELVEGIINNSTGRSLDFGDFLPRLKEAVYEQQYEYNEIEDILSKNNEDLRDSDQISQEELMFLMSNEEESEEESI